LHAAYRQAVSMKPIHDLSDDEWMQLVQRAAALPEAPAALVRAALDLWPAQPLPAIARAAAALRHLVAALSFDSWVLSAAAPGIRSLPSEVRHLVYAATGCCDIDLRIASVGGRFEVAGQVLGIDAAGTLEWVRWVDDPADDPSAALVADLDELGEFRLGRLSPGTYRLTLRVGDDEIADRGWRAA
jgi:hypothetical protein